jgi:transcriptional regulator with XRE-family HTH domain
MSSNNPEIRPRTGDIGWRVGRLRKLRGLSQNEVARRTGKHTSFISRVERPESRQGVPKRETIEGILDAINATPEERAAVFQVEMPPPTEDDIARHVKLLEAQYEDSDRLVLSMDSRWVIRYMSRRCRRALGLTDEEYGRLCGMSILLSVIDPASPMYRRYPENERLRTFSVRAAAFQLMMAEHQFDQWYLDLVERIRKFPTAEQVWHTLPVKPAFADHNVLSLCHPGGTVIRFSAQLRQLYEAPRFTLIELTAADAEAEAALAQLAPVD